jgi:hypothetical protein
MFAAIHPFYSGTRSSSNQRPQEGEAQSDLTVHHDGVDNRDEIDLELQKRKIIQRGKEIGEEETLLLIYSLKKEIARLGARAPWKM